MAKGQEAAKIVADFSKEVLESINYLKTMIPCIIPNSEEDGEQLMRGLSSIKYIEKAFKDCGESLRDFDEIADVDKIVEEYPKIQSVFMALNKSGFDTEIVLGGLEDSDE